MNQLLLFIIIILLICYCIKNNEGFGMGGQLVIPDLVPRIFYPELNLNSSNICEDKREWKNGELNCLDYSFEGTDCDDTGDDGTTATKSCPISCNSCDDNVLTRKNYGSTNKFSDNKMLERLPSPVSEFEGDLSDYGVFGPDMGNELRTSGEADSYTDLYKEDFSKIFEKIDELFDITSAQSGSGGVLPGCDILESKTFDPNSYDYLIGYSIDNDNQYKFNENDEPINYTGDNDPNKNIDDFSFYKLSCDDTNYYYDCKSKKFYNEFNQLRPITELVTCSSGEQYEIKFNKLNRDMVEATNENLKEQIAYMVSSQFTVSPDNIIINDKKDGSLIVNFSIRDDELNSVDIINSLYRYSQISDSMNKYSINDDDIYYIDKGERQTGEDFRVNNECCNINEYVNNNQCVACPSGIGSKIVCKNDDNNGRTDVCVSNEMCFDYKGERRSSTNKDCLSTGCDYETCYFEENGQNPKQMCGQSELECPQSLNGMVMKNNILKVCEGDECSNPDHCCEEVKCQNISYNSVGGDSVYIDTNIISKAWAKVGSKYTATGGDTISTNIMNTYNITREADEYSIFLDVEQQSILNQYLENGNFKKICKGNLYEEIDNTATTKTINYAEYNSIRGDKSGLVASICCQNNGDVNDICIQEEGLKLSEEFVRTTDEDKLKKCDTTECDFFKYREENDDDPDKGVPTRCEDKELVVILDILIIIFLLILINPYVPPPNGMTNILTNKNLLYGIIAYIILICIVGFMIYYSSWYSYYNLFNVINSCLYVVVVFVLITKDIFKNTNGMIVYGFSALCYLAFAVARSIKIFL